MSDDVMNYRVGDWVRFYQNGRLVTGVVEYIQPPGFPGYRWLLTTDVGGVEVARVLESRRAAPTPVGDDGR